MRKLLVVGLVLVGAALLGTTFVFYSKYQKSAADFAQATADHESMRQRYDRAVSEIVTIQDSLSAIVLGGEQDQILTRSSQLESQPPGSIHDEVLTRISQLKSALERTKDRIEDLDSRLKKSGVKIAGLERMITGLRNSVAEKETRIATLTTQVDTLETRVVGLSSEVDQKQAQLAVKELQLTDKQRELATIYYTMGTKSELTNAGIVEAKGGVLGLGKTLKPSGYYRNEAFTALDTDQENVIRVPAEKAQILSAQPTSSYTITPVGEKAVEIHIVNPEEFRKIKHVVILTT